MKNVYLRWIICIVVVINAAGSFGADWPQWRGPERTGHVPAGAPVPTTLAEEPKVLWRVKVGDGLASPVVAGGRIYYLDNQQGNETLHAADVANGNDVWQTNIDKAFTDGQSASGPRCAPLVDGDRVYAQSCRGELQCLKITDGSMLWHANFTTDFGAVFTGEKGTSRGASRHGNDASPVVDGDTLYALVGSTNGAGVVAFDKKTGQVLWKSQNDEAAYSAPMVVELGGTKQLVAFMVDGVIGLALNDGKLLWRVPLKTSFGRHVTTPVVLGDVVLVASHEIGLTGIKVSHDGGEWKATQAWIGKDSAVNFSCPVAVGGFYYGLGPVKNLFCVDIKTGKQTWSKDGYFNGAADHAHGGFVVLGDNILTLTDSGQLVLYAADATEFKEKGKAQVCGRNWCDPAYADGKLYLRDGRELMCVGLAP